MVPVEMRTYRTNTDRLQTTRDMNLIALSVARWPDATSSLTAASDRPSRSERGQSRRSVGRRRAVGRSLSPEQKS